MDTWFYIPEGVEVVMKKTTISLFIVTLFVIPMLTCSAGLFEEKADFKVLDPKLINRLSKAGLNERFEVIIQFKGEIRNRDIDLLDALNFDVKKTFHVIPAVYAIGSKDSILRLSRHNRIFHIEYNERLYYLMDESTTTINATKVWASQIIDTLNRTRQDGDGSPLHIDGQDITVVVVDSGIDAGHPDLDYREKTIMNLKSDLDGSYTEAENTDTSSGHGTHCSGTIAGNGDASGGARKGVAPGAKLIGISTGEAVAILNALGALEWVYDHSRPNANPHNIRAVSNSWGSSGEYNPDNSINQVTRRLVHDNNVAVVFAAGNDGGDGSDVHTNPYSLEPSVISVAAMERDGSGVASFSSRGAADDIFTWPDIGAPGVHIWATEARKTLITGMTKQNPEDAMDGYYMSISGTSMATPHVSGLVALLFQAAPSLMSSDVHDDYQEVDDEYWQDPYTRIHEVELIMKLTADYVPHSADNGVPSNHSSGVYSKPHDFAQGYGLVNAERAVALALTLEEMRRSNGNTTVIEAYRRHFNITTKGTTTAKTNVLATSWTGDWSQLTDPENPMSVLTTQHPRSVFVHNKTSKIIVVLTYEAISTSDLTAGTLVLVIDYDGDGNIDWRGDSSFSEDGIKHDEIHINGEGGRTGQLWEINVEGNVIWSPKPKGIGLGENEFNEAIIEYTVSLQMVIDIAEDEVVTYDTGDLHAKIAQPEFGDPTPEYQGNGSIEMTTYFYDLTKVYPEEEAPPTRATEGGFPWWALLLIIIIIIVLFVFIYRSLKKTRRELKASLDVVATQGATQPSQPSGPQITGEIVEVDVTSETTGS